MHLIKMNVVCCSGLFSSLVGTLQVLALQGNRVRARDVEEAVAPVTSLTSLDLSRNPLGDLCPDTDPRFHARGEYTYTPPPDLHRGLEERGPKEGWRCTRDSTGVAI